LTNKYVYCYEDEDEDEYEDLNSILEAIERGKYIQKLRDGYMSQDFEAPYLKVKDWEILKNEVRNLMALLSKHLKKKSRDLKFIKENVFVTEGLICEVLDFIQVHFHNSLVHQSVPEHLDGLELHYKLILNFSRAKYHETTAKKFLIFSKSSSNIKKLAEMDVPSFYQYYKDKIKYSQNEFKHIYKVIFNRNDNISMWLKENSHFTDMIKTIDNSNFFTMWDEVRKMNF
jgi:hypothetical protein